MQGASSGGRDHSGSADRIQRSGAGAADGLFGGNGGDRRGSTDVFRRSGDKSEGSAEDRSHCSSDRLCRRFRPSLVRNASVHGILRRRSLGI